MVVEGFTEHSECLEVAETGEFGLGGSGTHNKFVFLCDKINRKY